MRAAPDFDTRERRSWRLAYALAVLFYALAYALCRFAYGPVVGFVMSSPVLAVYVALLFRFRSETVFRWFKWLALRQVDGRYYAFQDRPVQVRWNEGQCWVRARDAFRVVSEEPGEQALRRLAMRFGEAQFCLDAHGERWFGEDAILEWLESRAGHFDAVARKFHHWLQREVFPPMHRRAELG
jgi:hypothetical protein